MILIIWILLVIGVAVAVHCLITLRFTECVIAIAMVCLLYLEFIHTHGTEHFDFKDIEIDPDTYVSVKGWVEYEQEYLEDCNYFYNSYVFVNIDSIEGVKADDRQVAKHLTEILHG